MQDIDFLPAAYRQQTVHRKANVWRLAVGGGFAAALLAELAQGWHAIARPSQLPPDGNGFRGAVLLTAGEFPISGQLHINASGVVLRGVGSFTNGSGTVLRATASNQYSLVRISGSGSASTSTTHNITNNYVPVGARSFNVDSTSGFNVGDHVVEVALPTCNPPRYTGTALREAVLGTCGPSPTASYSRSTSSQWTSSPIKRRFGPR